MLLSRKSGPIVPMMVGLAAATLLLFKRSEPRVRRRMPGRPLDLGPALPLQLGTMRRRLLGLAPAHVTALLGPPRATAAMAAEATWYYPLGRQHGAMAIRFDHSRHATAVTFLSAGEGCLV